MSWPLASHFSALLQNPRFAFRDPQLQQCSIEKDERRQPKPWAGSFAVVYKGFWADGRAFALRVFTTESPERRERYDQISAYLRSRYVPCLVDFEYRDRSIRSAGDGKWYPLVLMDWVEGETLFKWVRARALEADRQALAQVAHRWKAVIGELARARIAHGDLQHANVMVTASGELKLVDYDCLCVPSLVGRRNLEVGVEPYQHPDRNEKTLLGVDLDNFSALVIYVALRALAANPLLWSKYVEAPAHDKLLFRKEDFQAPTDSLLYRDLKKSPESEVRDLSDQLFDLAQARIDQVPALSQLTNSYARIEELLRAEQWEPAVELLNRRGNFRDAPAPLKPLIEKAYEHVCRQLAWAAFERIPRVTDESHDRQRCKAWNEELFRGFEPAEQCRGEMAEAKNRVEVVDQLAQLVREATSGTTIAQEWEIVVRSRQLPPKYPHRLRGRVRKARHAVKAIRGIEQAVRLSDDDAAIVVAWARVGQYQCAHLVNPLHAPRIRLACKRLPLLRALRDGDRSAFVAAFDARVIRDDGESYRPYESALGEWVESDILPLEQIGLRPALNRAGVAYVDQSKDTFRVRWTWPPPRFADECLLGICRQEPRNHDDPRDLKLLFSLAVRRQRGENADAIRLLNIQRQWLGAYVVVWAVVDLGFRQFYSPPLVLGRLGQAAELPQEGRKPWKVFGSTRGPVNRSPTTPAETRENLG
jgi:hypothetical protein